MTIAKYAFPVPGGATADAAAQAKALQPPGTLKVGALHILVKLMPEAFEPPGATGTVDIDMHLLEAIFITPSIFSPQVLCPDTTTKQDEGLFV